MPGVLGNSWSASATPAPNPNPVKANADTTAAPAPNLFMLTMKPLPLQQNSLTDLQIILSPFCVCWECGMDAWSVSKIAM